MKGGGCEGGFCLSGYMSDKRERWLWGGWWKGGRVDGGRVDGGWWMG